MSFLFKNFSARFHVNILVKAYPEYSATGSTKLKTGPDGAKLAFRDLINILLWAIVILFLCESTVVFDIYAVGIRIQEKQTPKMI